VSRDLRLAVQRHNKTTRSCNLGDTKGSTCCRRGATHRRKDLRTRQADGIARNRGMRARAACRGLRVRVSGVNGAGRAWCQGVRHDSCREGGGGYVLLVDADAHGGPRGRSKKTTTPARVGSRSGGGGWVTPRLRWKAGGWRVATLASTGLRVFFFFIRYLVCLVCRTLKRCGEYLL